MRIFSLQTSALDLSATSHPSVQPLNFLQRNITIYTFYDIQLFLSPGFQVLTSSLNERSDDVIVFDQLLCLDEVGDVSGRISPAPVKPRSRHFGRPPRQDRPPEELPVEAALVDEAGALYQRNTPEEKSPSMLVQPREVMLGIHFKKLSRHK